MSMAQFVSSQGNTPTEAEETPSAAFPLQAEGDGARSLQTSVRRSVADV